MEAAKPDQNREAEGRDLSIYGSLALNPAAPAREAATISDAAKAQVRQRLVARAALAKARVASPSPGPAKGAAPVPVKKKPARQAEPATAKWTVPHRPAFLPSEKQLWQQAQKIQLAADRFLSPHVLLGWIRLDRYHRANTRLDCLNPRVLLGCITAIGLVLRIALLNADRFHPDEALYSYWSLQIATGRDILLAHSSFELDKPPVFFYIQAFFFHFLGNAEIIARLPSLAASILTILLVYALAARAYRNRGTALVAAAFMALSPFAILFSTTAFTDPLMVFFVALALVLAQRRAAFGAGLAIGLAIFTKQVALEVLPLLLAVLVLGHESGWKVDWKAELKRFQYNFLRFSLGLSVTVFSYVTWEQARKAAHNAFLLGAAHAGGVVLASAPQRLQRLHEWYTNALQYFSASPDMNQVFAWGLAALLGYDLLQLYRPRRGVKLAIGYDLVFTVFAAGFIGVNSILAISPTWDRYMLVLLPLWAVLLGRIALLPLLLATLPSPLSGNQLRQGWQREASLLALLLSGILLLNMQVPIKHALYRSINVGTAHEINNGIDQAAAYVRSAAPPGSTMYVRTLNWQLAYYLYDVPVKVRWFATPQGLIASVRKQPRRPAYIMMAYYNDYHPTRRYLEAHGYRLPLVYTSYRHDGGTAFYILKVVKAPLPRAPSRRVAPSHPSRA